MRLCRIDHLIQPWLQGGDAIFDNLINFMGLVGPWGYLIIFVIVMLECQALLGLFMPGESLVLIAGFLAEQGVFDLEPLVFVIAAAAILGDSIGYELGRYLGLEWLVRHGGRFGLHREHVDRVNRFFSRHGGKAVFASHFTHLMRALTPFAAGASRMRYRRFLIFNAMGCAVWATTFVMLGYLAGASWRAAAEWVGRASEILAGVFLFAIVLACLWRWLARHETAVMRFRQILAEQPRVLVIRRRFAPQLEFLRNRLSPQGYLGLQLTTGLLFLIGASWLFGGIAEDVMHGGPLTIMDKEVADWIHERTTPGMLAVMQIITGLGSPLWTGGIATLVALVLLRKRCWYRLLAFALVFPGGMLMDISLKIAFHRSRPNFEDSVQIFKEHSFPSGHTMAATLLYGVLAIFAATAFKSWRRRVGAVVSAFVMVLLAGFSRVYLGAHYPSDVLGAVAAGIAWLALCLAAVNTLRRYRDHLKEKQ